MLKAIQAARGSGKLNLSCQSLSALPSQLFESNTSNDVSFDRPVAWWEEVDLTRLVAADNNIQEIDPRIELLHALCVLDLHGNSITFLPTQLSSLLQLHSLNVAHNAITSLPNEICSLPLLELLLHNNQLSSLPDNFGQLSRITTLDLSNNSISTLPPSFHSLSSLLKLDLSHNNLSHLSIQILNGLQDLQSLSLSNNNLKSLRSNSDEGTLTGSNDTLTLPKLTLLDIKSNQLTEWDIILECPRLKDFACAFNRISNIHEGTLIPSKNLEILDIRDNNIGQFCPDILTLKSLKRLDFTNNSIASIPPELSLIKTLSVIHLAGNPLRGLPAAGGTVRLLQHLAKKLPQGEMQPETIPQSRSRSSSQNATPLLSDLVNIDLSQTGLVEFDISSIQDQQAYPVSINLSNNRLMALPDLESISKRLTTLILSKNKLTEFPSLSCMSLTTLDLSNNGIRSIPATIQPLPNLNELNLNGNRLTQLGTLPFESLSILLVSGNCLTDIEVPLLQSLSQLHVLDLSNNDIGMVPPALGLLNLSNLQLLGNRFRVPRPDLLMKGTQSILDYLKSRIVT
ncbi:hypothetical protein BC833DRAFT_592610 [Globomyces pollinis-pini]|nr:hypothetical protein BC833DRAFT_592610 [Globomyces pollinis-pini]